MSASDKGGRGAGSSPVEASDAFAYGSHLLVAVMAATTVEAVHGWPIVARVVFGAMVFAIAAALQFYLRRREQRGEAAMLRDQKGKWERYCRLQGSILATASNFLKDRYNLSYRVAAKVAQQTAEGGDREDILRTLREADRERGVHVEQALQQLAASLGDDAFLRPDTADLAVRDHFKVTYYEVGLSDKNEEVLRPKWRSLPNERQPKTLDYRRGVGAAGVAWDTKRAVICTNGGEDKSFKEMYPGQGAKYASIACFPVIEDIMEERASDVLGVLTVDSPVRRGYFAAELTEFWEDLLQPLCNIIVFSEQVRRLAEVMEGVLSSRAGDS